MVVAGDSKPSAQTFKDEVQVGCRLLYRTASRTACCKEGRSKEIPIPKQSTRRRQDSWLDRKSVV